MEYQNTEPQIPEEKKKHKAHLKLGFHTKFMMVIVPLAVLALCLTVLVTVQVIRNNDHEVEVVTQATVEKIINVSELSTFTAVYNGITHVNNEKLPDVVDYYVSYEARVNAGIDFEQVRVEMDEENKHITIRLPEVRIIDTDVDIGSLDFIFYNEWSDRSGVTETAYKKCVEDVQKESAQQGAILELAHENAVRVIKALTAPVLGQLDAEYQIEVA